MRSVLYAILLLLLSVNVLLLLPKALDLVQSQVIASNVSANLKASGENASQTERVEKKVAIPQSLNLPVPSFIAAAVVVEDLGSGTILFAKDSDKRVPIASTTKIMTALVAVEHFKANDVLTASGASEIPGSSMGLKVGEKLSFRSVIYGMLLNSGNDAAFTIANNYPGGLSNFILAMNNKAQSLGLKNSHFDNPAGFDSPNHYSSASDLAQISKAAMENSQLARVVSTKQTEVASLDKTIIHELKNLNKLLDTPGVLGIKTGTTPAAKENLVGLLERDDPSSASDGALAGRHKILTVVLGSNNRFGETQKLIDWVFENYTWR